RDSLTLRLFPEELGEVDISLRMSDGLLKISIASARPDTLVLLQNNHQMLNRALSDLGFADGTTQFEFTERRGSSSDSEEKRGSQSPHRLSGSETAHEPTQMSHRIDGVIDIRL
ncbi:flagellar hook-length control protein FliK, partial [Parvibaculum sp.]|uniref:flagellar hook-length control protein FliK n=1 Tax=Parvibaculum sp. TaxID=2024848 RepID=UPI003C734DB0